MSIDNEASRGAGKWDCKRDKLWVRFPSKEMKYLIFLFFGVVEAKRGI